MTWQSNSCEDKIVLLSLINSLNNIRSEVPRSQRYKSTIILESFPPSKLWLKSISTNKYVKYDCVNGQQGFTYCALDSLSNARSQAFVSKVREERAVAGLIIPAAW